mmetsp:Transcript_15225/g.12950  ORF Transcript_15225/g.12950 Transcript_15225/m.12950 type:complete len:119 (-) Transcript_15225:1902-2258(-)
MPSKRRNNGRNKKNRGHTVAISCSNCTRMVPKDKAIKRYNVRDMVDASSRRDLKEASVYEYFQVPKIYIKLAYCVSCAIHARIVRVRSGENRKIRAPPSRVQRDDKGRIVPAGQKKEE